MSWSNRNHPSWWCSAERMPALSAKCTSGWMPYCRWMKSTRPCRWRRCTRQSSSFLKRALTTELDEQTTHRIGKCDVSEEGTKCRAITSDRKILMPDKNTLGCGRVDPVYTRREMLL